MKSTLNRTATNSAPAEWYVSVEGRTMQRLLLSCSRCGIDRPRRGDRSRKLLVWAMCVGTGTACGFEFAESVVIVLAANGVRQVQIAESLTDNSRAPNWIRKASNKS